MSPSFKNGLLNLAYLIYIKPGFNICDSVWCVIISCESDSTLRACGYNRREFLIIISRISQKCSVQSVKYGPRNDKLSLHLCLGS